MPGRVTSSLSKINSSLTDDTGHVFPSAWSAQARRQKPCLMSWTCLSKRNIYTRIMLRFTDKLTGTNTYKTQFHNLSEKDST